MPLPSAKPFACPDLLLGVLSRKAFQENHCAGPGRMPGQRLRSGAIDGSQGAAEAKWEGSGLPCASQNSAFIYVQTAHALPQEFI